MRSKSKLQNQDSEKNNKYPDPSSPYFPLSSNKEQEKILKVLEENKSVQLNESISITPFLVPHRNELSETVGYSIQSDRKKVLYIPDIDCWD